ncbi:lipocalin family protein [Roseovarius sp. 2305UL8-3]|uniref:lipocalin family protein n=1 Tax=Roseovarius conchicola TaxID=3121636 RepID=UPI00352745AF
MRRFIPFIAPVMLAACLTTPTPQVSYRDADVPLAVTTRGGIGAMQGDWMVRGAFPDSASIQTVAIAARSDGKITVEIAQPGCEPECHLLSGAWPAERIAQNRLRLLTDSAQDPELWVIWMDEGVRTAVVGTPDGGAAFILDRKATGGDDRIKAAREILDFNGYDVTQLVMR